MLKAVVASEVCIVLRVARILTPVAGALIAASTLMCRTPVATDVSNQPPSERANAIYAQLDAAGLLNKPSTLPAPGVFEGAGSELARALQRLYHAASGSPEEEHAEAEVAEQLQYTGGRCAVDFRTSEVGALVRLRLVGKREVYEVGALTNAAEPYPLAYGIYFVWPERDGERTGLCRKLDITCSQRTRIDLPEGRERHGEERDRNCNRQPGSAG